MKRLASVAAWLLVAVTLCFVGHRALVGRADAGDDPLTTAMRKQIDASLVVFVGVVAESSDGCATYTVERYLKGSCFQTELDVVHSQEGKRDDGAPAVGAHVVVGVQLGSEHRFEYRLHCDDQTFAPIAWTKPLEDAVAHYVSISPNVAVVPGPPSKIELSQRRLRCMNNLSQLGQVHLMHSMENRAKAQKYSGPALFLSMRKNGEDIRRGDERVLLCPNDPKARVPKTDAEFKRWDDVDLAAIDPSAGLCSYAGRDFANFPIDEKNSDKEPIGACLHHKGGAVVVFNGGDAMFVTLEELGLASDHELKVGPDSKSPLLRKLR